MVIISIMVAIIHRAQIHFLSLAIMLLIGSIMAFSDRIRYVKFEEYEFLFQMLFLCLFSLFQCSRSEQLSIFFLCYFKRSLLVCSFVKKDNLTFRTCRELLQGTQRELLLRGLSRVEWHML